VAEALVHRVEQPVLVQVPEQQLVLLLVVLQQRLWLSRRQ
jgi:hypothetical protein